MSVWAGLWMLWYGPSSRPLERWRLESEWTVKKVQDHPRYDVSFCFSSKSNFETVPLTTYLDCA